MDKKVFDTERMIVRLLKYEDLENFHDMLGNKNVMQYIKKSMNRDESKLELKRFIDYYSDTSKFFNIWAIQLHENDNLIGLCGIYNNNKDETEIAYRFRESYFGKGLGSEVAKNLISYGLKNLQLAKLIAYVDKRNVGSVKILEREMDFVEEFYSNKTDTVERKYELSLSNN